MSVRNFAETAEFVLAQENFIMVRMQADAMPVAHFYVTAIQKDCSKGRD
jgi:hypothetical protein